MNSRNLARKKGEGYALSAEEIRFIVSEYLNDASSSDGNRKAAADEWMTVFLKGVCLQGMIGEETLSLTQSMTNSGEIIDLSLIPGIKVDKHSTGGVGDKVTLVVSPMVAAAGAPVVKMSGRGLGHTGGTADKLESIPGYRTDIGREELISNVKSIGISLVTQTAAIAPADKHIYNLRNATGAVASIPLIASSIMSKKLACGADAIVLDVTTGTGAFMATLEEALELARVMVDIGTGAGKETVALVTSMEEPLGFAIGNSLEVKEAIEALRGDGPGDLMEVCYRLGGLMLKLADKAGSAEEGAAICQDMVESGKAFDKFVQLVEKQGGVGDSIRDTRLLPSANSVVEFNSERDGFVHALNARLVGEAALLLGTGISSESRSIDHSVGIMLRKKIGDDVREGETLLEMHCGPESQIEDAVDLLREAYGIGDERVDPPQVIRAFVDSRGETVY